MTKEEINKIIFSLEEAKIACESSGYKALEYFGGADKTLNMPNGGVKNIIDYKLSRYA